MPKVISEKYENGVLVERKTEGANTTPWHWLILVTHLIVACSLAVLAMLGVHDVLSRASGLSEDDPMPARCEQPQFRS
jgi:hypothetical protein